VAVCYCKWLCVTITFIAVCHISCCVSSCQCAYFGGFRNPQSSVLSSVEIQF
ncbi:hypothetical protein LOTGIDRAFT_132050, partial [Lottia gigantea]